MDRLRPFCGGAPVADPFGSPLGAVWGLVVCVALVATAGGCRSTKLGNPFGSFGPSAPAVLSPSATAAEIVAAVNAGAARVQTYQAPSASISTPDSAGLPLIQASLAAERPLRFRLRATTALTGPEIDLGSNDERFWIWARRNEPPALYTARHDLWPTSPARSQLPIDPSWLIDAMGLAQLDPAATYTGPVPRGDGSVELRTQPREGGQRVYVVDASTAVVREQHVYDASGALTASALADEFRYDPATGASLPERVRLSVPRAGLELTVHTGPITINAPIQDGGQLWSVPQVPEAPTIDLTAGGSAPAGMASAPAYGANAGQLATPFGDRPAATQTTAAAASLPAAAAAAPAAAYPAAGTYAYPAATTIPATPPASGFVGLPSGGRALE